MAYARANPHRIRGRLMPVIVYDPGTGREAFGVSDAEAASVDGCDAAVARAHAVPAVDPSAAADTRRIDLRNADVVERVSFPH